MVFVWGVAEDRKKIIINLDIMAFSEKFTNYSGVESLNTKIADLAMIYVDLPKEREEQGTKNVLDKLEAVDEKDKAGLFLRSMLELELHRQQLEAGSAESKSNEFAEGALRDLETLLKNEGDFEIKYQNNKGREMMFGNRSLACAYLGDLYLEKYFAEKNDDKTNWNEAKKLYDEAIRLEFDQGRQLELKTIQAIRIILEQFGDEKNIKCWKTTRREDLRGEAADLLIEYFDDKKQTYHRRYIDVTGRAKKKKLEKQKWSPTYVMPLSQESINPVLEFNFDEPLVDEEELKRRPRSAIQRFASLMAAFSKIARSLEDSLGIRATEARDFRGSLYTNPDKLQGHFPGASKDAIRSLELET